MQAAVEPTARIRHYFVKPSSVPEARNFALKFYGPIVRSTAVDDVALIVSELTSNVVKHSGLPDKALMTLTCRVPDSDGRFRVEVSDASFKLPQRRYVDLDAINAPVNPGDLENLDLAELEVGGQGLRLFDELCESWEVHKLRTGKVVICIMRSFS